MKSTNRSDSGCYAKMKTSHINVKFHWTYIVESSHGDKLKKHRNDSVSPKTSIVFAHKTCYNSISLPILIDKKKL